MNKEVRNIVTWALNQMSQGYLYKQWSDAFVRSQNSETFGKFYEELAKVLDVTKLTAEEMKELRFGPWDDKDGVYLFPLWIVPIVPDDLEVYSISGTKMLASEAKEDLDVRFDCVAWGIYPHVDQPEK